MAPAMFIGIGGGTPWRISRFLAILAVVLLAVTPAPARAGDLLIFAAASLQPALAPIVADWRLATGNDAKVTYAGTPTLAKQIELGAPADVFVAADTQWMDYLATKGLIRAGTRFDRIGNGLVLIAPVLSARAEIKLEPGIDLAGILGDGRLAMGDPDSVPAGRYARAALEFLGIWPSLASRIAPVDNVRLALALVARGEAPLGIVYRSDARAEPKVRVLAEFPAKSHPPIVFPMAIVEPAPHPEAKSFIDFLQSDPSLSRFAAAGYDVLPLSN